MRKPAMPKWYIRYMIFIGMLGQSLFLAQFFKIIKNKSAQDISIFGFTCGFIAAVSWVIYGFKIKDTPLIAASAVGSVGSLLTLIAIWMYR